MFTFFSIFTVLGSKSNSNKGSKKRRVRDIDSQVRLFRKLTMVEEEEEEAKSNVTSLDTTQNNNHRLHSSRMTESPRKSKSKVKIGQIVIPSNSAILELSLAVNIPLGCMI